MDLVAAEQKELTELESFAHYCLQIKNIPFLSFDEEQELAHRYIKHQDLQAAHKLIVSHLRYVVSIARQYRGYGIPLADLVQEGNIGLMKAVKRFDPSRGFRLSAQAILWIKSEIANFIVNNWRLVKIATTKAQRKLFFNLRSLQQSFGTLPEDELTKIAHELKVKEAEVREMEVRMRGGDYSIFISGPDDQQDHDTDLMSILSTTDTDPINVLIDLEQDVRHTIGLYQGLKQLDDRSRRVIMARWLGDDENATLAVLADEFGVSKERVRQIELAAFQKLKAIME